ncbi:DUF2637 domain-containing protein [Spirillospora sp. CA-128828]|uniref:DUF2637 domain-containing protein n=1 Tax=Spirillospora sp. CA-128828 TaxID=3240033 RepID=UPI003D949F11
MNTAKIWATGAFLLGVGVSISANVAHTYYPAAEVLRGAHKTAEEWSPPVGAQLAAAFYPLALLLVVELLSRVEWPATWGWQASRYGGTALVAGVAAVVSYRHMSALLDAYGEDDLTAMIGPLAVDGLMVVASFALLALGRETVTESSATVADLPQSEPWADDRPVGMEHWDDVEPDPQTLSWWPLPAIDGPQPDETDTTLRDPAKSPELDPETETAGEYAVPDVPAEVLARARETFAGDLDEGRVPGVRPIRKALNCGQPRAQEIRAYLAVLANQ